MMMAAITDDDELMAIAGDLSAAPAGAAGLPMQLAQTEEGKQLQRTIDERRKGMFDDVGDGDDLVAKEKLVEKIDVWLAQLSIGGNQMRGFDPSQIVQFAWQHCLEDVDCDGIYRLFVENQAAEAKVRMSQAMGFEGVDMTQFSGMPASEMDAFAIRSGWLAHEISGGKLRHKFVRHWFALWHDPASSVRGNHPTMR